MDFFQNAHQYNAIPRDCPEIMRLAYERVMTEHLPMNIKDIYKTEEDQMGNYRLRFEEERAAGKAEGKEEGKMEGKAEGESVGMVKAFSEMGLGAQEIATKTSLSLEKVREILGGKH